MSPCDYSICGYLTHAFNLYDIQQARNQDFMWGGANEAKVDQTTEIYSAYERGGDARREF